MKITVLATVALLAISVTQVQGAPGYSYQNRPMQQQEVSPDMILNEGMSKLLKFMRQSERPHPKSIAAFVEREIAAYFDFTYMAQWAAGPAYRKMTEEQRKDVAQKVKEMLLTTLSKRLGSYGNQEVRFLRPRRSGKNEVKVRIAILQSGGYPAAIDFRFYRSEDGWKVFDVSANGNSALSFYRQHFARQFRERRNILAYPR